MNTNIVDYIIKNKKLTQSQIAEKMSVSQVAVSKWSRGENIPDERDYELLQMAGLYWEITVDEDGGFIIDSKWNILVQSKENQDKWYYFFKELFAPNKYLSRDGTASSWHTEEFVRVALPLLNDIGFNIPRNPEQIKELDIYAEVYDSKFFEMLYQWTNEIIKLQRWVLNRAPENEHYSDLYYKLPEISLAKIISNHNFDFPDYIGLSLQSEDTKHRKNAAYKIQLIESFVIDIKHWVEHHIESQFYWAGINGVLIPNDVFDEILIEYDSSDEINSQNQNESQSNEIQENSHWSEAERKIYEGIKNNERLLKELLGKLSKQEKE